jgi:hypothetical protein
MRSPRAISPVCPALAALDQAVAHRREREFSNCMQRIAPPLHRGHVEYRQLTQRADTCRATTRERVSYFARRSEWCRRIVSLATASPPRSVRMSFAREMLSYSAAVTSYRGNRPSRPAPCARRWRVVGPTARTPSPATSWRWIRNRNSNHKFPCTSRHAHRGAPTAPSATGLAQLRIAHNPPSSPTGPRSTKNSSGAALPPGLSAPLRSIPSRWRPHIRSRRSRRPSGWTTRGAAPISDTRPTGVAATCS